MPPKPPSLKFKPKLVQQTKQAVPPPSAGSSDDWEHLSLLQLERIRRQQDGQDEMPYVSEPTPAQLLKSDDPSTVDEATVPAAAQHRSPAHERERASPSSSGPARVSHAAPAKSATAQLHEASARFVDMSLYSSEAAHLPVNTIQSVLGGPDTREEDRAQKKFRPTCIADVELPATADTTDAASAPKDAETAGTAFLRAAEDEQQRACEANHQFHASLLERASAGEADAGVLAWMQLPRFHETGEPFQLQRLPPGRVGELKIFKSGRMVMDIAGVYYDVCVDGQQGSAAARPRTTLAVTQPPLYPMDPQSKPSFCEVGALQAKMVCTPTVQMQ